MNRCFQVLSWLCLTAILVCCLLALMFHGNVNFQTYAEDDTIFSFNSGFQIFALLLFLIFLILLSIVIRNAGRNVTVAVTLLCTLTVFLLGCVWIETNTYPPIADQKKVWNAIVEFADHNYTMIDRSYFEQYPFQGGIVVLFSAVLRILGTRSILIFRMFNVVAAGAIVATMTWLSWELFGQYTVSLLTAVMMAAFAPIVLYTSFVYGTLLSFEFALLAFAVLFCYIRARKLWKLILISMFMAVSNTIYSGSAIASIAIGFVLVLNGLMSLRAGDKKGFLSDILGVFVLVGIIAFFSNLCVLHFCSSVGISAKGGIPSSAYILMGITSNGTCGPGSYDTTNVYIYEISGRNNKAADREAWSRINYAVRDYIRGRRDWTFFIKKIRNEWTDPWFSAAVMTIYLSAKSLPITASFSDFLSGPWMLNIQKFLITFDEIIYLLALVSMIDMMLKLRRLERIEVKQWLLPVYFLGGFVFYLFWEAKPRYCFPYFVCLFPLAAYAANRIAEALRMHKTR